MDPETNVGLAIVAYGLAQTGPAVCIVHGVSLAEVVGRIFVPGHGHIVADGSYDELVTA